ncbi:hypothetical protein ACFTAO_26750 [Paenibacillus rhizoplanae]
MQCQRPIKKAASAAAPPLPPPVTVRDAAAGKSFAEIAAALADPLEQGGGCRCDAAFSQDGAAGYPL